MPRHAMPRHAILLGLAILSVACREPPEHSEPRGETAPVAAPFVASGFTPAAERSWPGRIIIDGAVEEWPSLRASALEDPRGDGAAPFDVTHLRAAREGERVLVSFEIERAANLYSGRGQGLVLVVEGEREVRVDLRRRRVTIDGRRKSWNDVDALVAPSFAARRFEIGLTAPGARAVRLEGADEAGPLEIPAGTPEPPSRSAARDPRTSIRLASLNTERGGIVDRERGEPLARLLRAADADVICLQELGRASREALAAALPDRHLHLGNTSALVGNAVASRHPLVPLEIDSSRFAAALVVAETPFVVVSLHLPCCGHLGSREDDARAAELALFVAWLGDLRRGASEHREAPVVLAGDFNDVGSPSLRANIAAAGLTLAPVTHLRRPATFTWGRPDSRFPPSTLDLVFHGPELQKVGGFILDTTELSSDTLAHLHLERSDSLASDHRLIVVDLALR